MKVAIYTSIFGEYDNLIEDQIKLDGFDYICFTDANIRSSTWEVVKSTPIYKDSNRNAKKYKILPHRYLKNYDYSIWIDGNIKVVGDVTKAIDDSVYKVYDHNQTKLDPRDCLYEEANAIFTMGYNNTMRNPTKGILNYKDNPYIMEKQINRYKVEGYPKNNGLATNPIIFRRHNDKSVIDLMESWWEEIKYNSRRDQLSFDYICWKKNFKYSLLLGDSRDNEFFKSMGKHTGKK
jgi:hypothetical protein